LDVADHSIHPRRVGYAFRDQLMVICIDTPRNRFSIIGGFPEEKINAESQSTRRPENVRRFRRRSSGQLLLRRTDFQLEISLYEL
jgi:hypothetical protein